MAKVINLRVARKLAAKRQSEQRAAENRALHGTPKAERLLAKQREDKARRDLELHRLDKGGG